MTADVAYINHVDPYHSACIDGVHLHNRKKLFCCNTHTNTHRKTDRWTHWQTKISVLCGLHSEGPHFTIYPKTE